MSTGTSLLTVKAALVGVLQSATNLAGIPVNYGRPQYATDLVDDEGNQTAIWLGEARGQTEIPYLTGPGSHPTRENYSFDVICQAITTGEDGVTDGQQVADSNCVGLFREVASAVAADPTVGVSAVKPLAVTVGQWTYTSLDPRTNAYGARIAVSLDVFADIAAP